MKTFAFTALLASLALARPQDYALDPLQAETQLRGQLQAKGKVNITAGIGLPRLNIPIITAHELEDGKCGEVVFIWARASTEPGNMGITVGPALAKALRGRFNTTVQGVNYGARLTANLRPGGVDPREAQSMADLWTRAATQCPDAAIVGGGYSQGGPLTHASIKLLTLDIRARITAVVTFGDNQKKQSGGRFEGIAEEDSLIICNVGDLVCVGLPIVVAPHFLYVHRVKEAADFIQGRIEAKRGGQANGYPTAVTA